MLNRLFVGRYLFHSARSSVVGTLSKISVVGIALGVMTMTVVLSVMSGFDDSIEKRILRAQPHLVLTLNGRENTSVAEKLLKHQDIDSFSKQDVIVRTVDGIFSGAVAYGTNSERLNKIGKKVGRSIEVVDGAEGVAAVAKNNVKNQFIELGHGEIAVGVDLARSLGIFEGDSVALIAPESLMVVGETPLYEKVKVRALVRTEVSDLDSRNIFFNEKLGLSKLLDTASMERGIEARFEEPEKASIFKNKLINSGYKRVQTWEDLNAALFYSLKMEKKLMSLFLGLAVLVSSFSIMSVLFLLVTEKQKDVGILKAMGARQSQILNIFTNIGMVLGGLGIGGGVFLGVFICWLLMTFPIIRLPDIYSDTNFPVHMEPFVILSIIVLGVVLTFISAFWPAYKVSKAPPLDSIRNA